MSFAAPHAQGGDSGVRHLLQGPATVEAIRGWHGFTLATAPLELPEGPWPRAASSTAENQHVRTLGALHSSHFPCLMTFRHLPRLHPPSCAGPAHSSCWKQVRTLACASLSVGDKTNGNGPCLLRSPW